MTAREIPSQWGIAEVATVCEIVRGVTYSKNESRDSQEGGYIPVLRANNIQGGKLELSDLVFVPEGCVAERQFIRSGDVIVAMSSGSRSVVGKAARATTDWKGGFGAFCGVLRPSGEMDSRYFYYFTQSAEYRQRVSELSAGVNINNLKPSHFEEIEIPVAPLAEQTRIAAKLDELLAQVDTLKARIDGIPALLKRFRQSVLAAAVSGRLTEEWRDTHGVQLAEKKSIEDLSELVTKGASPKWQGISYVDDLSQTLFVTSENVRSMHLDLAQEKYVEDGFNSLQGRSVLQFGDVLTNIVGASIGRAAVWRHDRKANINQAVCIIRPRKEALISEYLSFYLNSPEGVANLAGEAVDVARANVSLSAIKGLKILAPGIPEQTEIVRRVEQLFAFADQLEAKVNEARTRIDRLTQSILAKAFRGELVPQDPADEPASVLLQRIQAQRASAPKVKRGRKKAESA